MLNQKNSPKILLVITGSLVLLIVLFLAYQWLSSSSSQAVKPTPKVVALSNPAVVTEAPASEAVASTGQDTVELVNEDILKAAVPQDQSLAKEEVAKLEEIQTQLNDQQQMLSTQHNQADELIRLKEEQIKLLEAQLTAAS